MSIEVLTRRIERLKYHIAALFASDGATGAGEEGNRHVGIFGLANQKRGSVVVDGRSRDEDRSMSNMSGIAATRQLTALRTATASRLPNASFGAGATLVSRQRLALANAVQQAAARGVAQIREELLSEENALYEQLLQRYVQLCEQLLETPDPMFLSLDEGNATREATPTLGGAAYSSSTHQQQSTDTTGVTIDGSPTPTVARPTSATLQRSNSVVGLDHTQRSRNAKIEQLSVQCQLLLTKKRKFDLLDAKLRDSDQAATKFQETLQECSRLVKMPSSYSSSITTGGGSNNSSGVGGASISNSMTVASQARAAAGTKLAPLSNNAAAKHSRQQLQIPATTVSGATSISPTSAASASSGWSPARTTHDGTKVDLGSDATTTTSKPSNSKKVLQGKVNESLNELRMSTVRLLLYFKDLQVELGIVTDEGLSNSGHLESSNSGGQRYGSLSGSMLHQAVTAASGASVLLGRKQQIIFDRLAKTAQTVRYVWADASEFCPSALGAVCSTPLFVDVAALNNINSAGIESFMTPRSGAARKSSAGLSDTSLGDIPVAVDRRQSFAPVAAVLHEGNTAMRKRSVASASIVEVANPPMWYNLRSGIGTTTTSTTTMKQSSDADAVLKAYEVWKVISNTNNVDLPPTAVPFVDRYVAAVASHPSTSAAEQASSPPVSLRCPVIDPRHPELLHGITTAVGCSYSSADLLLDATLDMSGIRLQTQSTMTTMMSSAASPTRNAEESVIAAAAAAAMCAVASSSALSSCTAQHSRTMTPGLSAETDSGTTTDIPQLSRETLDAIATTQLVMGHDATAAHHVVEVQQREDVVAPSVSSLDENVKGEQRAVKHHAVRAALLARQQSRSPESPSPCSRASSPVRNHSSNRWRGAAVDISSSTTTTSSAGLREQKLAEIASRLQELHAARRIQRFAEGFVLGGRGHATKHATPASSSITEHEISALEPYEAQHRQFVGSDPEWRDMSHDVRTLSEALNRRDEAKRRIQANAVMVIVRFLRNCVVARKNRHQFFLLRRLRIERWAVRAIEEWWITELPALRARRHAHSTHRRVKRDRHRSSMKQFETLVATVAMVQRLGRGYHARRSFGAAYPSLKFNIQKAAVSRALWFRDTQKALQRRKQEMIHCRGRIEQRDLQHRAAMRIQALVRGVLQRKQHRLRKAEHILQRRQGGGVSMAQKTRSARVIQRAWRRALALNKVSVRRSEREIQFAEHAVSEQLKWARSKLSGLAAIVKAKRDVHNRRIRWSENQKRQQRARQAAAQSARLNLKTCLKNINEDAVLKQATDTLLQSLNTNHESSIVQRHLNRILKLDAKQVPGLDLEANFLSNVSEKSRTLEREDDSFEVRMLHRLLQAPIPVLFSLTSFCAPLISASVTTTSKTQSQAASKKSTVAGKPQGDDEDESDEAEPRNTAAAANSYATVDDSDDDDDDSVSSDEPEPTQPSQQPSRASRCLFSDDELMNDTVPTPAAAENVAPRLEHAVSVRKVRRPVRSARITTTSCDDDDSTTAFTIYEDENGVPSAPTSLEPFAKWTLAHRLVTRIFDEGATYAWKMIFSHTAHDEYKQSILTTDEEREARLARVRQRNQLILACYDCESEAQWLSSAKKNLGFVGRIWNPIRYLDPNEDDLEQRAIESYEFVDGFLMQCFPSAFSLRDVPELLVGCGLYMALHAALHRSLDGFEGLVKQQQGGQIALALDEAELKDQVCRLVLTRSNLNASSTTTETQESSATATTCGRCCLENLALLHRLSEECLSPCVTIAPMRRAASFQDDAAGEMDEEEEREDIYGCDDDTESRTPLDGAVYGSDSATQEIPSSAAAPAYLDVSDVAMPDASAIENDQPRDRRHVYDSYLPDRSEARLGFIGEGGDSVETSSLVDQGPPQTHHIHQPQPSYSTEYDTITPVDGDDGSDDSGEMDDTQRDEELAKQILLESYGQRGGALDATADDYAEYRVAGRPTATEDDEDEEDSEQDNSNQEEEEEDLNRTGCGWNQCPPTGDTSTELDGEEPPQEDPTLRLEMAMTPHMIVGKSDQLRIRIFPSRYLPELAAKLTSVLLDVRVDTQMLEVV